jgi:hypothetical protein
MCYSATASFGLSGILIGVGTASIARNTSRPHRLFAGIPFVFAAQQAAEGIVWLTMGVPSHLALHRLAVSTFMTFALVVWPTWVPVSLQRMERNLARRRVLTTLCWFSAVVSALAALLLTRSQAVAHVVGHSISYSYPGTDSAALHFLMVLAYVVAVVVPLFVSTAAQARTLGVALVLSVVVTFVIQREALTSVWCFCAAILSGLIVLAVERENRMLQFSPATAHGIARPDLP